MEADDDLVPDPDAKGFLDLTNRAWVNLDPRVWTFSISLVVLEISYNHIHEIPQQIGQLVLLKELRASFNKISSLPDSIGRLKRLRVLRLTSNRITKIPAEIGKLEQLEELSLNENLLESIPNSLALCPALRTLKLQNNRLKAIPFELADVLTLEEILCDNNPQLDMIPENWKGDSSSVIFICKVHRTFHARLNELLLTNNDLVKHSQFLEQEQLLMKENVNVLRNEIEDLKKNMPKKIVARMEKEAQVRAEMEADAGEAKQKMCAIS